MQRYYCRCGNEIFFENIFCNSCSSQLGFIPENQALVILDNPSGYRPCEHRAELDCNWLISNGDLNPQCRSCRLTRTIPNLSIKYNLQRWIKLESTKRRAFYLLLKLKLPIPDRRADDSQRHLLLFDFLEDRRSNRYSKLDMVYTGHSGGIITLNAAEADDSYRSAAQQKLKEAYRTLLGHFRHELGHFYWLYLQDDADETNGFREHFGDERQDYQTSLKTFYRFGARRDWQSHFISAYASAHPLEDWAECWAHYLHIRETLETASAFGLLSEEIHGNDFMDNLSSWIRFSVALNALNRSMGISDPYPFVINPTVEYKLRFIDRWVKNLSAKSAGTKNIAPNTP